MLSLAYCVLNVEAQTRKHKKIAAKSSKVKAKKTIPKTISAGVVNGRAIDLVRPEFPPSAIAVNVYRQVSVQVLIDENGDVISAKAVLGHPLLRFSSEKAASQSKFEPINLSGTPVRVSGTVFYNFIPERWNWLEIGFTLENPWSSYYSIKTLLETLPFNYSEETQLLIQWFESPDNRDEIIETIIASLRGKLSDDEKASWLFEIGLALAKSRQEWNIGGHSLKTDSPNFQNLKILTENPPNDVKVLLLKNLEKFIVLTERHKTSESFQILRQLEENFSFLGR